MNTVNVPKPSQKIPLLILLGVLLIGVPLTVITLQQTQILKNFAWQVRQSADSSCDPTQGGAIINVHFTNTEDTKSIDVIAKDIQSGKSVNIGTVKPKETKANVIQTNSQVLDKGVVQFSLTWTDGSPGFDTFTAEYAAVQECQTAPPFCPAHPEIGDGKCTWEPAVGATGYEVEIDESDTGSIIKKELVSKDASESAFPMTPGKGYICQVTAISACTRGTPVKSPEKVCSAPTPTPSLSPLPTPPQLCPVPPLKVGVCSWDALDGASQYTVVVKDSDSGEVIKSETVHAPKTSMKFTADPQKTYQCTVTPVNQCNQGTPVDSPPKSCTQPSPSVTPTTPPSVTPSVTPTVTPTVPPSATPVPPTATPVPPTATPIPPTATPAPTATPMPTPTPVIIVRIPPNTLPPTTAPPVIVQQPPVIVQRPPVVIQQPGTVIQQPGTVIQVTAPPQQVTPAPTMKATGNTVVTTTLVGASTILLIVGAMMFFVL